MDSDARAHSTKIEQGILNDGFTTRDVRRNRWRYLTNNDAVEAALDWLECDGWLKSQQTEGAGRHTWRYNINPKIKRRKE